MRSPANSEPTDGLSPKPYFPGRLRGRGLDLVAHVLRHAQDCVGLTCQDGAFGRELDAAAMAQQQADAEFFFQHAHLPAQRRLSHAQLHGGTGDAAVAHDFGEVAQVFQVHDLIYRIFMRKPSSMPLAQAQKKPSVSQPVPAENDRSTCRAATSITCTLPSP